MIRTWWSHHRVTVLHLAIILMTVAAIIWLSYQFWRLVSYQGKMGAIDLKLFHAATHSSSITESTQARFYPPATFIILWPLLGWLAVTPARWLWAVTTILALAWLVYIMVRESGATSSVERLFIALLPLSMYATGATIGNGQLLVHLMAALLTGLLLLRKKQARWQDDLLAASLIVLALVKPIVAAPFFWMVLFIPNRRRPALFVTGEYAVLTLLAAWVWRMDLLTWLGTWSAQSVAATVRFSQEGFKANVQSLMSALGLGEVSLAASLVVLFGLGAWVYFHRHSDMWVLLGVTALASLFWTNHSWYDELLMLLPLLALFRIAKRSPETDRAGVVAGVLFACMWVTALAPGGRYLFPLPWNTVWVIGQACVWLVVLVFLLMQTDGLGRLESTLPAGRTNSNA